MYDCIILGSGCAGLSAAIYAQRAKLNTIVIEKIYKGAGQITESERVDNYMGLYGENGFSLGMKFREHAEKLGTQFIEGTVTHIEKADNHWNILTDDDKIWESKTVIYALGTQRRKLNITGEKEYTGKGVSYCAVCDGAFYRKKIVAVVGGGDTALGDALLLSKFAEKVYLIHRRNEFRANRTVQETIQSADKIECMMNSNVTKISGERRVKSITVRNNTGEETEIAVNGVFVAVGSIPNSKLLENIAEIDDNGYVKADETGITTADGLFVAGDVRTKMLRQVITAASDGANCVFSVEKYLREKCR